MDVPVAAFQLRISLLFGSFSFPTDGTAYLIGKAGKQCRVTTEAAEHTAQLLHIGTEQAVALCAAYLMGQPFTGQ